jgi:hypothetical protein
MSNKAFFGGFLQAFTQAKQQKQDRAEADQEKKAKVKLFELQLAREQRAQQQADQQQEAKNTFFREAKNKLGGVITSPLPGTGVELGDVGATMASGPPPSSLVEMLADPQMALRALQAGIPLPAQAEDPLARVRELAKNPDLLAVEKDLRASGANRTVLAPDFRQETEEAKVVGRGFAEQYMTIQKSGVDANAKLARLDRAKQLMRGMKTGKLAPAMAEISAMAEAIGLNIDPKLGEKQALIMLTNEMALQLRNPSGGAGLPGAMSDADRVFLGQMPPGLGKTSEGNALIMETFRKLAQRDQDVAKLARAYRKKHGAIDEGFYDELAAFSEANPLFGDVHSVEPATSGDKEIDFSELPD